MVVVAVGGVHGCCCSSHWIVLWGLHHSSQYWGVLEVKWKKKQDAYNLLDDRYRYDEDILHKLQNIVLDKY